MTYYDLTRELARDVVRALGYTGGENLPADLLDAVHDWLAESADLDETLATSPETLAAEWQREFPDDSEPTLYTSDEAAAELGITRRRVLQLAESRNVGRKLGRDWVFTNSDIDAMRVRVPGRPATNDHA
jgi:hypothetical protein